MIEEEADAAGAYITDGCGDDVADECLVLYGFVIATKQLRLLLLLIHASHQTAHSW